MQLKERVDLLNLVAVSFDLKSYLEIGVQDTSSTFDKVQVDHKIGVDPDPTAKATHIQTSDEFFAFNKGVGRKFDLVLIDGLHHADQAHRDFENSLECLNPNGFILLHDSLPDEEKYAIIPRGNATRWFGDVYKFVMILHNYPGIDYRVIDFDCGCTLVWKTDKFERVAKLPFDLTSNITWAYYEQNKATMPILPAKEDAILEAIGRKIAVKKEPSQDRPQSHEIYRPTAPMDQVAARGKSIAHAKLIKDPSDLNVLILQRLDSLNDKMDKLIAILSKGRLASDSPKVVDASETESKFISDTLQLDYEKITGKAFEGSFFDQ